MLFLLKFLFPHCAHLTLSHDQKSIQECAISVFFFLDFKLTWHVLDFHTVMHYLWSLQTMYKTALFSGIAPFTPLFTAFFQSSAAALGSCARHCSIINLWAVDMGLITQTHVGLSTGVHMALFTVWITLNGSKQHLYAPLKGLRGSH